jgi:hypothetical protein
MARATAPAGILLTPCSPAAIAWFIAPVVVYAVNGQPFRPRPHIGVEIGEVIPPLAHSHPSTAVVFVLLMLLVVAPGMHRFPDVVFGGPAHAVSGEPDDREFRAETSTTFRSSRYQVDLSGNRFGSAIAAQAPHQATILPFGRSHSHESPESLAYFDVRFHTAIVSKWAVQVGDRAKRLAKQMREG